MTGRIDARLIAGADHTALLENGVLVDYRLDGIDLAGSVVVATVDRIHSGLNAAFIRMGDGTIGLLSGRDVRDIQGRRPEKIGQAIRQGQRILVQIQAPAHDDAHEHKGPSLTQDIALTGRFLVHRPLGRDIQLSKRLKRGGFELTTGLRQLLGSGGWTIRQAAESAPPDLVLADAERLLLMAKQATAALTSLPDAGTVVLPPPSALERLAITLAGYSAITLLAPDYPSLDHLKRTLCAWPDLEAALPAAPVSDPISDQAVADGLSEAADVMLPLPSGGNIIIESTAALSAIDINGGETGHAAALSVNLEAAGLIARQLRLRNIGGPIMVDVLRLSRPADRERLVNALAAAACRDPLGLDIYGYTGLGFLEIARPRRGLTLADARARLEKPRS